MMIRALLAVFLVSCVSRASLRSKVSVVGNSAVATQIGAREILPKLVYEKTYRAFGFKSLNEATEQELVIGSGWRIFQVDHRTLAGFSKSDRVDDMFLPTSLTLFLVGIEQAPKVEMKAPLSQLEAVDAVRTTITVATDAAGRNRPVLYGGADWARALAGGGSVLRKQFQKALSLAFIVEVPALSVRTLAFIQDDHPWLLPVTDDGRFGFRAGSAVRADVAFLAMKNEAKAFEGLDD